MKRPLDVHTSPRPGEQPQRRLPIGAELIAGGVHFRVWAPSAARVEVVLEAPEPQTLVLTPEQAGYHAGFAPGLAAGALYRMRLDGRGPYPDPASRFQPEGPHGPSEAIDPAAFRWSDAAWRGVRLRGQVIYEMHIGTFTAEGTWSAAMARLPALAELGVTLLEIMPVAEFAGSFGWGYDGVDLFAPTRLYGRPDDFRRFVDAAHACGLGVILDVVYNHLGPDGNYLGAYSPHYFAKQATEWGDAINFDGEASGPVRELFVANAGYWIDELHLDGLRLDATHSIFDRSREHIVTAVVREARRRAGGRSIVVIAENEQQRIELVEAIDRGGCGVDAIWNDDFHHSALAALTGRRDAYLRDYRGEAQELLSAVKHGFLYQGQWYSWQKQTRGTPSLGVDPATFVTFIQNHDQVANNGFGFRLHQLTSPGRLRAMTALHLLAPGTPMLFQGQEHAASSPWLFFADHHGELGEAVRRGRAAYVAQFKGLAGAAAQAALPVPNERSTFERCRLDWSEQEERASELELHRALLRLRREDPVFSRQGRDGLDGAVLAPEALLVRFFDADGDDRVILVNLGADLSLASVADPLLAPPRGYAWEVLLGTEEPRFGGGGTPEWSPDAGGFIAAHSALVLGAIERGRTVVRGAG